MERHPAVGSKCGVGIMHVCQVKDHHQERSDNKIDCSPSHLAHYIKKTVTVRFILDHPVEREPGWYNVVHTDLVRRRFHWAKKAENCVWEGVFRHYIPPTY